MNQIKQNKLTLTGFKRWFTALILVSVLGFNAMAQIVVSGGTGATAGSPYGTIGAAITAINAGGALTGPVTVDIPAGYTETLTGKVTLTMTGTAANTITIQKSGAGANPVFTSYTGTVATPSVIADGFFVLAGCDYVTIDGINLQEAAGNTTTTTVMEYGFGLFKASATDGCQNNTIKNCSITLNRLSNTAWTAPGHNGSTGIAVLNGLNTATGNLTVTAASGSNSFNKFYSNTIQNCNAGIVFVAFAATSPYLFGSGGFGDTGNDVGGLSSGTGNTILNFGGGAATNPATGIFANNQWGMNCSYNTINNNNGSGINHTTTLRGIFLNSSSTSASVDCNNNTVTMQGGGTTSLLVGIDQNFGSTAASNTINVNNNVVNIGYATATTGVVNGILNSTTAATVNINGNTIQGISGVPLAGTGTHVMIETGSPVTVNTNNNIIQNFVRNGASGSWRAIKTTSPTNWTANGNTIENLSWTAVASTGSIDGIYSLSSAVNVTISNNIIRNLSVPTTGTINGIREFGVSGTKIIQNNQVYNFSTVSGGAGGATMNGIFCSTGNLDVSGNTIYSLNSTGTTGGTAGTIYGIQISGGTTHNIYKNSICDLSSTSTNPIVGGILNSGATTITYYNNRIGDLRASAANAANPVIGINITGGTTVNAYYNTVYLNASSTGALFGSSAISASTTPNLTLRNNILVNTSTSNGAGLTVAYRRSSTTLTTYNSASNTNLFYSTGSYFTDGTNTDATFAAYKLRVASRDAASVSEAPNFLSTTCGNSNFLKINTAIATQIESSGAAIAGITDDFEGDTRNATTPDIGADEFAGIAADFTAPTITYTPLTFTCSTSARTLTASITDLSGVPTSGPGLPVLYWSINNIAGPFTAVTGTHTGGSSYDFTFGSGVTTGDNVYYYIVAQDNAGTPNVIANPAAGAAGYSANPPAASTPPSGPSFYNISSTIGGTYTVGAAGTYPTLTAAVNAYNTSCLSGPVVFNLIDATYSGSETFPIVIGNNPDASATNTLTIKPATTASISGSVSNNSLIRFTSARYVTIDGSNSGGNDQSLTITNSSTTAPTAFSMVSMGTGLGTTNSTIKNCILSTGTVTSGASYGISIGATTPGTSQVDNDNATVQNNTITGATIGIYAVGGASVSAGGNDNLTISGNSVTTNTTLASLGIQVGNALNSTLSQNTVSVTTTATSAPVGISLETGFVSSVVTRNNITNVSTTATGGYGGRGIAVGTGTATSSLTISNNFISGVNGPSWTSFGNSASMGIAIGMIGNSTTITTTAGGLNIYFNTVNMYGNQPNGGYAGASVTAALYVGTGASALDIRNNILVNSQNNPNGSGTASKNYAIYSAATNAAFSNINYNDYYVSGTQGVLGFISSDRTNLAAIVTGFGQNANSVNIAPVFTSPSDLHLDVNNNLSLNDLGVSIGGVTVDYDGTTRSATPDMGADEFTPPSCVAAVGGTASGSITFCNSGTPTITASGYSSGVGSGYQWMSSTNSGDYPLAGTSVSGQTNPATLTTGVVSTTTYYWLRVTCATNSSTDYSNMITITINPSVASISGPSSKCANDPAVTLTENGGTGTSWLWSTSETTQSISVNPSSTTTYTVTVTSPGSCTATATKTITVSPNPTGVTASASASSICNGSAINLTSTSNPGSVTTVFSENFNSTTAGTTTSGNLPGGWSGASLTSGVRIWGVVASAQTGSTIGGGNFLYCESDVYTAFQTRAEVVTPVINLAGYTSVNIKFKHYYNDLTAGTATDSARVYVSNDGGTNYTLVQAYDSDQGTAFSGAGAVNATLPVGIALTNNMKIKLVYNSDAGGNDWYWAVDDFVVEGIPSNTYAWTSTPSGFTSAVQNPTGVTPTVSTDYTVTVTGAAGCTATASTGVVTVNDYPVADAPANVTACDSYTLPALTVGNYFSGSGGTGTAYSAGNNISSSMTMYVYAETGTTPNCTDENSFTITINNTPVADAPANVTACDSYTLPALSVGNYFSGPGGTGTAYNAGNSITSSMTMYVYAETGTTPNCTDENSFTITINNTPNADAPANVTACDFYTLPALTVGNYFSGTGGTGTAYSAGNNISSSMTMYVYAETGTTPNCTDENSFTITINTSPTATISGDASICAGGSTNLTLNFTGTGPWTYAINGGSAVSTSNNPETVSVSPASTTVYTITSLSDANCSGTGTGSATVTVSPAAPDFLITFQPGPVSACVGNTANLTLNPVNNAQTYTWSAPAGTLINGQVSPVTTTSNSVTLTLGAVPANGSGWNICVFASNPCGNSQTKCAFIRGALSTPAAITGDKTACPNTSATYSTNAVAGANSYLWTGTNGITFTGSGTTVTANFPAGFTTGTICVAGQLSCGYTGPTRCITVTNAVGTLGVMSGAFAVCPGQSGLVFSVPPVAGVATYNWTTPTGVSVTSGAGTNSVTVNVGGTFTVGNICVTATSICGVVSAPRCKTISSIKPGTPGNITGSATGVCNTTVTYSVPAVAGVTSYNWTLPSGATFATANGTNTVDVTFSNSFTTGQLCVSAVNGCGASTARCINVKGAPAIPGTISAPGVICANEQGTVFSVNSVFGATTYTWVIPATATLIAGQGTNSIVVDWGANGGLVMVTASNGCGNSGTRTYLVTLTCRSASTELPGVIVAAYPNPVSSTLTVSMDTPSEGNFSMMMTDLTGRVMFEQKFKAVSGMNETAVDVSTLAKGIYMLTVKNENGFAKQIRVTVQ